VKYEVKLFTDEGGMLPYTIMMLLLFMVYETDGNCARLLMAMHMY